MSDLARRQAEIADVLRGVNPGLAEELDAIASALVTAADRSDPMTRAMEILADSARREERLAEALRGNTAAMASMQLAVERLADMLQRSRWSGLAGDPDTSNPPATEETGATIPPPATAAPSGPTALEAVMALPTAAWVWLIVATVVLAAAFGVGVQYIGSDGTTIDTRTHDNAVEDTDTEPIPGMGGALAPQPTG